MSLSPPGLGRESRDGQALGEDVRGSDRVRTLSPGRWSRECLESEALQVVLRVHEDKKMALPEAERDKFPEDVVFHDLKPEGDIDKIRRIKFQQTFLANGQWHIQFGMDKFISQYTKFPRARPVDVLDAWAYCDYLWDLPKKMRESNRDASDWNRRRTEFHKRRRTYG